MSFQHGSDILGTVILTIKCHAVRISGLVCSELRGAKKPISPKSHDKDVFSTELFSSSM